MGDNKKRVLFTDDDTQLLAGRERDMFPAAVRAPALRLLWGLLAVAAICLAVLGIVIGRLL